MYRFAPSPTGDMHIGNLRAALFNYICACQTRQDFILRIEDTDKARNIAGKGDEIQALLRKFGVSWQHFYIQSANAQRHIDLAESLVRQKKAFYCFCSPEKIEAKKERAKAENRAYRYGDECLKLAENGANFKGKSANSAENFVDDFAKNSQAVQAPKHQDFATQNTAQSPQNYVIRIKAPTQSIDFTDFIKGELHFEPQAIDSFIILRSDKSPTYNFACVCDDMDEGVSFIIRGEDHTSNTPKQEHLRAQLGCKSPLHYAHLPIILNENGQKMSKREAHSSVQWLLNEGILPEAIANYLIMLGNKTPKEIFTLPEAIEFFDLKKVSKAPAKFDLKKLLQINREHIKLMENSALNELLAIKDAENAGFKDIAELAKFYTQEASTLNELREKLGKIFAPKMVGEFNENCEKLAKCIGEIENLHQNYEDFKDELMKKSGLKGKDFYKPLRILLTRSEHGPELAALYPLLKPYIREIAGC